MEPLPVKRTWSFAEEALPEDNKPDPKEDVGSWQLSGTLEQLVPVVGADAVAKTPWARLSEP